MKSRFGTLAAVAAFAASVFASSAMAAAASDVRVSTDPAKIAAIERHAKDLQARESAAPGMKTAAPMDAAKPAKAAKRVHKTHKAHKHHARKPAKA